MPGFVFNAYFNITMNPISAGICVVQYCIYWINCVVLSLTPRYLRKRKDITGQNVLITGAGNGVGRELAIEFSKYSVSLMLLDIDRESLLETDQLLHFKSKSFVYECDVSKPQMVYEIAEKIKKDVGNVDILVNNAGILIGKYLADMKDETIIKTMEVNALSHFWTCKAFLPAMMEKNKGHIVSIASSGGRCVAPKLTDYCSSKFAAIGFAESLEIELRERNLDGIKITIVCPSIIDTAMCKGAKMKITSIMTPRYVAEEVVAGVLEDVETVYLPHYLRYLIALKQCLPRCFYIWIAKQTGDIKGMEHFVGRNKETITA